MIKALDRPIWGGFDGDDIDSPRSVDPFPFLQESPRRMHKSLTLRPGYALLRCSKTIRSPRLHLDEDNGVTILHHQIYFAFRNTEVPFYEDVRFRFQVAPCLGLPPITKPLLMSQRSLSPKAILFPCGALILVGPYRSVKRAVEFSSLLS